MKRGRGKGRGRGRVGEKGQEGKRKWESKGLKGKGRIRGRSVKRKGKGEWGEGGVEIRKYVSSSI